MKTLRFNQLLCLLCFVCLGFSVKAQTTIPIVGPAGVCVLNSGVFSVASPTPGVSYSWGVVGGIISSANPANTITINWPIVTTGTVTVNGYNSSNVLVETGSRLVPVSAVPQPVITTNFRVACKAPGDDSSVNGIPWVDPMPPPNDPPVLILDDLDGCVKVCENSLATYYATAPSGGSLSWSVSGGTIVGPSTGSSVDVMWGPKGPGSITATETINGCAGEKTICISIIEKPEASFAVLPDNMPPVGVVPVCDGSSLVFKDLSTASATSPIVSWYWDFGDGTASSQQTPPQHTYTGPGNVYIARLVVTNACGCSDSFEVEIEVQNLQGPDIECVGVACEGDSIRYTTSVVCGAYNWKVTGGTIQTDYGNSVTVKWDNVDEKGYGFISLSAPCGTVCPGSTTKKVPVIQQNPKITGPLTVCMNTRYEYSIPLWGGTQYNWGVIGMPHAVKSTRTSNRVVLEFDQPGTWDVHLTWQNRLALCGGDTIFQVTVLEDAQMLGPDEACMDEHNTVQYQIDPPHLGMTASWVITDPLGNISFASGDTYDALFDQIGLYTLEATGDFCPLKKVVTVRGVETPVNSVTGEYIVCLNQPYTYTAGNPIGDAVFEWSISGGTLAPSTGNSVTVTWTSPTGVLGVRRVSTAYPFCPGPEEFIYISEDPMNPNITGTTTVCANGTYTYDANYTRGELYEWSVLPETAGSVASSPTDNPTVDIEWTNVLVTTQAQIILKMQRCGTTVYDTLDVTVEPSPTVTIAASALVCSGDPVSFTATPGAAMYEWDFGDNSPVIFTASNAVVHTYYNPQSGNQTYTVKVNVSGSTQQCAPVGMGTFVLQVKPGLIATISTPDPTVYCTGQPISATFTTAVQNNVGSLSYQWYNGSGTIPGATAITYNTTTAGFYYVRVTDNTTGCSYNSNPRSVLVQSCTPGPGCVGTISISGVAVNCNTISANGSGTGSNGRWVAATGYSNLTSNSSSISVTYPDPGIYTITYLQDMTGCTKAVTEQVHVPLVGSFYWNWQCSPGGYTIELNDNSRYLVGASTPSISWQITGPGGPYNGTGNSFTQALSPGSYTVTETVSVNYNDGSGVATYTCIIVHNIVVPVIPTVSFNATPGSICEGLPISFTPVIGPGPTPPAIANYSWDFDDGSGSRLMNATRSYEFKVAPSPQSFSPTLTVTDALGCTYTSSPGAVNVFDSELDGELGGDIEICNGPVTINYSNLGNATPTAYLWSNSSVFTTNSSINVNVSGSYNVKVRDNIGCLFLTNNKDVTIYGIEVTGITGDQDYCEDEDVVLSAYSGGDMTYQWYRGGSPISGATDPHLIDAGLSTGTYHYYVEVSFLSPGGMPCTSQSDTYIVTIHPAPNAPSISGPTVMDCNTYELQLTGSQSPGGGSFNWSNGTSGTTNHIYEGGQYRLWYTDQFGCKSYSDVVVPQSPVSYFDWFPSGCYNACATQFPFTIYGPPGIFGYWDWNNGPGSIPIDQGNNTVVDPLSISSAGSYYQKLNTGLCDATTEPLHLSQKRCVGCAPVAHSAQLHCDPSRPFGYTLDIHLDNYFAQDMEFTIGLNYGPVHPFKVTLPPGPSPLVLNATMVSFPTPPVYVEISWTLPNGERCYQKLFIDPPPMFPCPGWPQQKQGDGDGEEQTDALAKLQSKAATGMLVYPNPAADMITINYSFGQDAESQRELVVYDLMGRRVARMAVNNTNGTEKIATATWVPGLYLVRMEEDGKAVHSQRLTINH